MVAGPMVRSISLKRVFVQCRNTAASALMNLASHWPLWLQIDQQMFDKFSKLKTVFCGQYRFKGKPSTGFIRRPGFIWAIELDLVRQAIF